MLTGTGFEISRELPSHIRTAVSRTISVREAAAALGITPRAVTYRLEKGSLKGTLSKNEFGVPEWRISPNKEIMSGLNKEEAVETVPLSFEPADVVEVESVEAEHGGQRIEESETRLSNEFQTIVEQCVRPLVEEVKAQALALAEKDRIIEEQSRQLRLLPDYQRRAEREREHAETERNSAELRALEIEALNKQIAVMSEERQALEAKASEATALSEDIKALKNKVEELQKPWWRKWFSVQE